MPTSKEMGEFIGAFTLAFRLKFGDRAAVVVAAGMPEQGNHDAWASSWAGPCLTAKGLIHHAIPELDKTIAFVNPVLNPMAWKPCNDKPAGD